MHPVTKFRIICVSNVGCCTCVLVLHMSIVDVTCRVLHQSGLVNKNIQTNIGRAAELFALSWVCLRFFTRRLSAVEQLPPPVWHDHGFSINSRRCLWSDLGCGQWIRNPGETTRPFYRVPELDRADISRKMCDSWVRSCQTYMQHAH